MDSVFSGNSASAGGGICSLGTLTVTNCSLAGNIASDGGGIHVSDSSGQMTLNNSVLWQNASQDIQGGGEIFTYHNLIGIDPLFIRSPSDSGDGWGDNPDTPDIDESLNDDYGDLRLRPDSPAIDAGRNDRLPADEFDLDGNGDTTEPIPFDLAGNARVENGTVDMGAYEYVTPVFVAGDLNGDGMVGGADLDIVRANWGRSVAAGSLLEGDPSGDGVVGGADLDIVRANWGSTAPAAAGVDVVLGRGSEPEALQTGSETVYGPRRRGAAKQTVEETALQDRQAIWAAAMEAWERETGRLKGKDEG